ncbi:unnamed protein product [Rhizopus stolonifer]
MDLMNKEVLMKRLADASQSKIYPTVASRYEVPLRKILLTTRLWNHVRKEQDLLAEDNWLDEFMFNQEELKKNPTDWSWIDQDGLLFGTIDEFSVLSHEKRKREDEPEVHKKFKVDQDLFCFSSDTPPAGPASPTSPVLLSA